MVSVRSFAVDSIALLGLVYAPPLEGMYSLSPFVWRDGPRYAMLLRLVNRADDPRRKVSRIHLASSDDGIVFRLEPTAAIAPGADGPDRDGCEDPTMVDAGGGIAYYSGWNGDDERSTLLFATRDAAGAFAKRGTAIAPSARYGNPKEASVVRSADGTWRLFFEYAADGASKIGCAHASAADGPWTIDEEPPFVARADAWDAWHLSPGPMLTRSDGTHLMFYNGGTADAAWRIGWAVFEPNLRAVVARCDDPLIVPPPPAGDESDIAFAASAVVDDDDGTVQLYYSVADKFLKRASLSVA